MAAMNASSGVEGTVVVGAIVVVAAVVDCLGVELHAPSTSATANMVMSLRMVASQSKFCLHRFAVGSRLLARQVRVDAKHEVRIRWYEERPTCA